MILLGGKAMQNYSFGGIPLRSSCSTCLVLQYEAEED